MPTILIVFTLQYSLAMRFRFKVLVGLRTHNNEKERARPACARQKQWFPRPYYLGGCPNTQSRWRPISRRNQGTETLLNTQL